MENPDANKQNDHPAQSPDPLQDCTDGLTRLSADLPEEPVQSTRTRILAAVRGKQQASANRRTLRDLLEIPGWAWGMGVAVLVVVAFVAITTVSDNRARKPKPMVAEAPVVERTAVPPPAVPKPEVKPPAAPKSEEPVSTLAQLQAELQRLKASDKGVTRDFVHKIHRHIVKLAETPDQQIAAQQLMVAAYEEMGEKDEALAAFERYLDLVEKRDGREKAATEVQRKAERLFYDERDRLSALAYCDLFLSRYPESKLADSVRHMTGRYYELEGMPDQALSVYRNLAATGTTFVAWQANIGVAQVLYNSQKKDEAFAEVENMIARYPEKRAYLFYHKGMLLQAAGVKHYPAALRAYQVVITEYPETHYAGYSRNMVAIMTREMCGSPGESLP
jgi:tetratricopeptide (TPR) repeat protein